MGLAESVMWLIVSKVPYFIRSYTQNVTRHFVVLQELIYEIKAKPWHLPADDLYITWEFIGNNPGQGNNR